MNRIFGLPPQYSARQPRIPHRLEKLHPPLIFFKRIRDVLWDEEHNEASFAKIATLDGIARQDSRLAIPLYVKRSSNGADPTNANLPELWAVWDQEVRAF